MRIVEKILHVIGGLLALMLLFIAICHFNPTIAEKLGEILYAKENEVNDGTTIQSKILDIATDSGISQETIKGQMYEVPQEELEVSAIVAAMTGYNPIEDKGKSVSDEEAQSIAKSLSMGDIGEGLSFDKKFYPYYYMLNDAAQAVYRQIYANTNALIKSFAPVTDINAEQLKNAFTAVCNDHPELFWLETGYTYKYASNGKIYEIDLKFNYTAQNAEVLVENQTAFEEAAMNLIYMTRGLYEDYDKEVCVHDNLISQITYDIQAPINQSAYSALVNTRTVCAGYAKAFQYVMQKLGVPCYYVTGYAGQNHAWNMILLDDDYYNVDVTWDDTNPNTRDYFNCSDAEFESDHIRKDLSVYLPACLGTAYGSDIRENEAEIRKAQEAKKEAEKQEEEKKKQEAEKKSKEEAELEAKKQEEQTPKPLRTLEQCGFDNSDVIMNIETYYRDCIEHILSDNDNTVSFTNVVDNEALWKQIANSYDNEDYLAAYMDRILVEKHLNSCSVTVNGELLADGSYLIKHKIVLK